MQIAPLRRIAVLAVAALALPADAADVADACRAASATLTRPLIELYTSEGCDSCPPADRWLAANFATPDRDARAVALAFHVDYWDRLGWVDRFASHAYTERQYAAMRANRASFVYTPQVLLQGRDFPAWRNGDTAAIDTAARKPARATLTLDVAATHASIVVQADAVIADPALRSDAQLFVAYAESGLHSDVSAGENRGVRLAHEHVVRALRPAGAPDAQGRIQARVEITRPRERGTQPLLVAFVQRQSNGDVLQTLPLRVDACAPQRAAITTR